MGGVIDRYSELEAKEELLILVSDANCQIQNEIIKENHPKITPRGKLLLDLIGRN